MQYVVSTLSFTLRWGVTGGFWQRSDIIQLKISEDHSGCSQEKCWREKKKKQREFTKPMRVDRAREGWLGKWREEAWRCPHHMYLEIESTELTDGLDAGKLLNLWSRQGRTVLFYMPSARHQAKCFTHIVSWIPCNKVMMSIIEVMKQLREVN